MTAGPLSLLGGLDAATFLKRHWQKKPLLVRGAFRNFVDPVTPDELAGLATEPGVQARLVQETGGKKPWELTHGPFPAKRLRTLPRSHWTLLVSRVNEWVDEAALMLDRFAFVPGWRLDDLMVSFAPEKGTVGPHVDSYDVFLIQGMGRRRWEIAKTFDPALRPGLDLRVLKRFKAEEAWDLEPGDMLYLPPNYAHHGVALEPCLTYSVGFRAPKVHGLMLDLLGLDGEGMAAKFGERLYEDPDLTPPQRAGEIDAASLARMRALALDALNDDRLFGAWLGKTLTRPERSDDAVAPGRRPAAAALEKSLATKTLWRADDVRLAWMPAAGDALLVFVDGDVLEAPAALAPLLDRLCGVRRHAPGTLLAAAPKAQRPAAATLLAALAARRAVRFA